MADSLTAARLRRLLDYNPSTGHFIWRKNNKIRHITNPAGTISHGYRAIRINGRRYGANRLAVLWMTGRWSKKFIDHINGIKDDNRWCNLREANQSENIANSKRKIKKLVPLKGVSKLKKYYVAQIKVNYCPIWLGSFDSPKQAHEAYKKAARKYFGKFARFD